MIDPFEPAGTLGVAVDKDESVDHGRPTVSEPGEDVGAKADAETHAVRYTVVVKDVLDLEKKIIYF